jgi:hypothetical protein
MIITIYFNKQRNKIYFQNDENLTRNVAKQEKVYALMMEDMIEFHLNDQNYLFDISMVIMYLQMINFFQHVIQPVH